MESVFLSSITIKTHLHPLCPGPFPNKVNHFHLYLHATPHPRPATSSNQAEAYSGWQNIHIKKPFKNKAMYFSPHLLVPSVSNFPGLLKSIILTNLPGFFQWSINYFAVSPELLCILKPMPPGCIQEEWQRILKKVLNKERGIQRSSSLAYVPHCPRWALSSRPLFGKVALETGRKKLQGRSSKPAPWLLTILEQACAPTW